MLDTLQGWADHLGSLAAGSLAGTPLGDAADGHDAAHWIAGFRDERGHRRVIDRPLLAWVLGRPEEAAPPAERPVAAANARADAVLWRALAGGGEARVEVAPGPGPLFPHLQREGVELWTEAELAGTHALWNLVHRRGRADLRGRVDAAMAWLIEELQPDNATNHPWAIQAFAMRGVVEGDLDARHYAETLLHNAIIELGRPERFSAVILWDAAAGLRDA